MTDPESPAPAENDAGRGPTGVLPGNHTEAAKLLEPGDLIFGQGGNCLSKVVRWLSGTWSHVGIYVGDSDHPPGVAHFIHTGPEIVSLQEFMSFYDNAVGSGRFGQPADEVAARARKRTKRHIDKARGERIRDPRFGYVDLGLAAAILIRAQLRSIGLLEFDEQDTVELEQAYSRKSDYSPIDPRIAANQVRQYTCSGFVFSLFKEAGLDLEPVFPEYVDMGADGRTAFLRDGSDPLDRVSIAEAYWHLDGAATEPGGMDLDHFGPSIRGALASLKDERKRHLLLSKLHKIVFETVPHMSYYITRRVRMPISLVVGPNDLWRSPTLIERRQTADIIAPPHD